MVVNLTNKGLCNIVGVGGLLVSIVGILSNNLLLVAYGSGMISATLTIRLRFLGE